MVVFIFSYHVSKDRKTCYVLLHTAEEEKTDAIQTRYTLQTSRVSGFGSIRTEILCKTPGTASGRGAVSIRTRIRQPVAEVEQSIPAGASAVCCLHEAGEIYQSHCG